MPDSIYLHDSMDADKDVKVYEELNNAEILKSTLAAATSNATDSSDDDKVACGFPAPDTTSQVMDSLATLCSLLGAHNNDISMQLLTKCEQRILPQLAQKKKQTKIDYFLNFWKSTVPRVTCRSSFSLFTVVSRTTKYSLHQYFLQSL